MAAIEQRFGEHIQELRRRLLLSCLSLIAMSAVAFAFRDRLIDLVTHPIHEQLIYTAPSGGLQFMIQVCLTAGMIVTLPVFVHHFLSFIRPAFKVFEDKRSLQISIIAISYILALSGVVFAYYLVLPLSFHFFAGYQVGGIKALISTSEYFTFVSGCLAAFAAIFQLPLLLVAYNHINRFPPGTLGRYRRHVIIGSLGLALVLPFTYDPLT